MKISTIGGKPLISGSKVVVTSGGPCACGDCGGGGGGGCPPGTGACCRGDGSCTCETEEQCIAGGGTFQGGDCPCCCGTVPTLVCDQISASESVCGYAPFSHDGGIYLTTTTPCSGSTTYTNPATPGVYRNQHWIGTGCCDNVPCNVACPSWCGNQTYEDDFQFDEDCHVTHTHTTDQTCIVTCFSSQVATLSDLFSAADLIAETEAALPAYDGDYNDPCIASRNLAADFSSYSISRLKYKFTWDEPLTKDCKVCWIIRTTLSGGDPTDEFICETVSAGSTESSVHEVLEPSSNGTISVVYPVGACCASNGDCSVTDQTTCENNGGEFQGVSCNADACDEVTCTPKTGACCNYDDNTCTITTEAACNELGNSWAGPDTICPDDCFF